MTDREPVGMCVYPGTPLPAAPAHSLASWRPDPAAPPLHAEAAAVDETTHQTLAGLVDAHIDQLIAAGEARVCEAGHRGPLPPVPDDWYPPGATPLPPPHRSFWQRLQALARR